MQVWPLAAPHGHAVLLDTTQAVLLMSMGRLAAIGGVSKGAVDASVFSRIEEVSPSRPLIRHSDDKPISKRRTK